MPDRLALGGASPSGRQASADAATSARLRAAAVRPAATALGVAAPGSASASRGGWPGRIGRRLRLARLLRPRFELDGDRLAILRERQQGLTLQRVALLRRGMAQCHSLFFPRRDVGHVWFPSALPGFIAFLSRANTVPGGATPVCRRHCIAELWATVALAREPTPRMKGDSVNQSEQEGIARKALEPDATQPARNSPTLRIVAARALVAVLDADERGLAAFRALCEPPCRARRWIGARQVDHLALGKRAAFRRQEADIDKMLLDDVADRCQQRGHVTSLHPRAAARIEHRFQLLDDEGDIAAAAEHGTDHPRQADGPGVVFHVLRIDEDLERADAIVLQDVVDGDVEGVLVLGPADLVGPPRQLLGPV